jgi:phosphatidylinositol alpha-mannosyltransferase
MRIAFFSTSLPELGRKPGGVDANLDRLAEQLSRRHELTVFSFSPPPPQRSYRHVQLQPSGIRYSSAARLVLVPIMLNRVRFDADVLHLHGDDGLFVARRLPSVRTFYGSALDEFWSATRWRRRAHTLAAYAGELAAARLATACYAISPFAGSEFGVRGVLPPGVALRPRRDDERATVPTILFIGTWEGRKRGRVLAEHFAKVVRPALPNAELVMVSDHAESQPGVRLVRHPTDDEVGQLMRRAWIFCLPSSYEGFGIPYAEAMATGVPVLATDNIGANYVLAGGDAGMIVDIAGLGQALRRLLTNDELRAGYAERGLKQAEAFVWERCVELHEAAYEDAIMSYVHHGHASPS